MDYIRNSKNRKLKTQFLNFTTRILYSGRGLDLSGKIIFILLIALLISLFFPWVEMRFLDNMSKSYSAFSLYLGGIGYGIVLASIGMMFFLFSHEKKERIRAYVPFRLSDAQAIVFLDAMILTALGQSMIISLTYTEFALNGVSLSIGFSIALTSSFLILLSAFFYSRSEKRAGVSMSYLDKKDGELSEYSDILNTQSKKPRDQDKNMTLPI